MRHILFGRGKKGKIKERQLADNQARGQSRGAVREGSALLKGLLVCGHCGCRIMVQYDGAQACRGSNLNLPRYVCARLAVVYGQQRL